MALEASTVNVQTESVWRSIALCPVRSPKICSNPLVAATTIDTKTKIAFKCR
ncbi:unnamed protein product [Clavelina lepadiformis]|uniref:Uncharacterized protein n=1 Tax=Clavelina lepadiformis TaxID=159417 RepID=A0ABP0GGC4_CLALP